MPGLRRLVRVVAFGLAWLASAAVFADDSVWPVPGDAAELQRACLGRRGLETFGQSGYLGIESGYQAVLLGSQLPIAPAAHAPWAKPYARGPIKLLIVTTFGNACADVEELAQVTRELDVDVRWLLVADMAVTHPDYTDERYRTVYLPEQARTLLREEFDAILVTFGTNTPNFGTRPAHPYLPDDIYHSILDKVQRGTGLVIVGQSNGGSWVKGTPLEAALPARMTHQHYRLRGERARITDGPHGALFQGLDYQPAWYTRQRPLIVYRWRLQRDARVIARAAGRPAVMARTHGQGRIVLLGWDGTLGPRRHAGRTQLEHSTALTLKALTFAARKEPDVQMALAQAPIRAGEPGSLNATLTHAAHLTVTLRDDTFRALHILTLQARAGDNTIRLPSMAKGEYFVEAIARDAHGRVLTWSDQNLHVRAAAQLTVETDKQIYRVGETVRITARAADLDATQPLHARLSVRDATGRVVAQQSHTFAREGTFEYPIASALVAPHKVTLELSAGTAPLLNATARFFVPTAHWDDYENVLWPASRTTPTNVKLRDEAGFTAVFDGNGEEETSSEVAHYGQKLARLNDVLLSPGLVQTQPLAAAQFSDKLLHDAIEVSQRYGALLWLLQDERHHTDDSGPPDSEGLARYRMYLRSRYGNLQALNDSWGTRYKTWEQVQPTLTAAVQSGVTNLAPWVDFRLYVADQAFEINKAKAQTIRDALGEDSLVGLDGFTTSRHALPYGANDYGRLASEGVFNFYSPYNDDFVFASLINGRKAKFVGWSMSRGDYFGVPWRDAFRGNAGSLRFFGPTFMSGFGHLQPAGRWTGEGTRELREGVGKLLMDSERELSPVVILYSYASMIAGSGAEFWQARHGGAALAHAAGESRGLIEQSLWAAGASFGYQTDAQVAQGSLKGKRLLIIPRHMGLALSNATVRAIEQFAREGGTVLADLAPALCDEHGKPRATGALDALFGVQTSKEQIVRREREFRAGISNAHALVPEGEWFLDEWYDKGLRVTDGRALGAHAADATPAFVVKQSGRGRALLLNTLFASRSPNEAVGWPVQHALLRSVLAAAGVQPPVRVEAQSGQPETHCEVNSFRDGANSYVGFYAHNDPEAEPGLVRAHFETDKETYDVRAGRNLGRVREIPLPLRAQQAALFARLDYKPTALHIATPPTAAIGQPVPVTFTLDATAPPGRHVVHVEIIAPNGKAMALYTQNTVLEVGHGHLQLHPALNDPAGTWQIKAREVITGLTAQSRIELR